MNQHFRDRLCQWSNAASLSSAVEREFAIRSFAKTQANLHSSNNMTLPDNMDKENTNNARKIKVMGHTLNTCIKQAFKRKGLTCGMTPCGELLHSNPGTVMFCVLPMSRDISVHIHQMLIQAFCRENNILILELAEEAKLAAIVDKLVSRGRGVRVNGNHGDTSCVLIQYPKLGCSKHDQMIFGFHEEMAAMCYPTPHWTLPD